MPADLLTRHLAATDAEIFGTPGVIPTPVYRIFLRTPQYEISDELDSWLSFDAVIRGNGVGTWSLEIANDVMSPLTIELQEAWGIVVTRDGVIKFSGSVTKHARTFRSIKVSGEDDNAFLKLKALSDPLTYPPAAVPPAYDVNTAQASSVLLALVNNNIGPAARPDRKVAALTLAADPHVGSTITARADGSKPLVTLMAALAATPLATGLAFRILQSATMPNALEFRVWAPVDRSADAKFSVEAESAQDYEDIHEMPAANAVYLYLGDGLAGNRTVIEAVNQPNIDEWGRRREVVIDRKDIAGPGAEATQALAEAIATTGTSRQVSITPIDVPDMRWGHEWDLLDLVSFSVRGETFTELVREIHLEWIAGKGMVVTPTIGQNGATNDDQYDVQLATMQDRLSDVERNWRVPDNSVTPDMLDPFVKWQVGDLKLTARATAQAGWLPCQGQAVSRTTYAALFAAIGTTFGVGDGSTTFNVPDFRNRFPIGAGSTYSVGANGGTTSVSGLAHTHAHSHGGGTLAWKHTHPGSHSHGIGSHNHTIAHNHTVDIDHDHPSFNSGARNNDSPGSYAEPAAASGAIDHHHVVNVPALGSMPVGTSGASGGAVSGNGSGSTDPDSNVFDASAGTPPWSGGTDSDSSAASYSGGGSASVLNPYLAVTYEIYAGV